MSAAGELDEKLNLERVDESLVKELGESWKQNPSDEDMMFQYAMVLSKSRVLSDKQTAIELFRDLLSSHVYRMDALYALGECHYYLGQYENARNYSEELLRQNPDSSQARTLQAALIQKQRKEAENTEETLTWIAVGVGVAAIAGMAIAKSLKR